MGDLIELALLIAERAGGRTGRQATANVAGIAVTTVAAACCGFAAIACALAALWLFLLPQLGPTGAPLVIAGVLVVMCGALLAVLRHEMKPGPPPPAGIAPSVLLAEATRLLNENKAAVLMAALLAGLVAGRRDK